MLRTLVREQQPGYLTTYTRNPAIIKMIRKESSAMYPLDDDEELRNMASNMSHASSLDATYHINRYSEQGLFVGKDPASQPLTIGTVALREQFPGLASVRNALVLAARVKESQS